MRILNTLLVLVASSALAACGGGGSGGGGAAAPTQVAGTWGADCTTPFVKFDGAKMTVFPDNATYALKSATLTGDQLVVGYDNAQGAVTETYVVDGATLRLDHGTYGGSEAVWHKQPMNKCA